MHPHRWQIKPASVGPAAMTVSETDRPYAPSVGTATDIVAGKTTGLGVAANWPVGMPRVFCIDTHTPTHMSSGANVTLVK